MRASIKGGFWALVLGGAGLTWLSVTAGPPSEVRALSASAGAGAAQDVVAQTIAQAPVDQQAPAAQAVAAAPVVQEVTQTAQAAVVAEPAPVAVAEPAPVAVAEETQPVETGTVVVADATSEIKAAPQTTAATPVLPAEDTTVALAVPAPAPLPDASQAAAPAAALVTQDATPQAPAIPSEPALALEPETTETAAVVVAAQDSAPAQNDFIAQLQAQATQEPVTEQAPQVITAPAPAPRALAQSATAPVIIQPTSNEPGEPGLIEDAAQEGIIVPVQQDTAATGTAGAQDAPTQPQPVIIQEPVSTLPRVNQLIPSEQEAEVTQDADAQTALEDVEIPQDTPAIMRHAALFDNPEGLPVVGLVLIDTGAMENGPAAMFDSGFTATVVLDALMQDAGLFAEAYVEAGMEVAMQVPLPDGATPADVEVAFSVAQEALPQAAVLYSDGQGALRGNVDAAEQAMAILAADGRGLITIPRGLGGLVRVAESVNVPVATVSRDLDDNAGDMRAMLRTLDRVAFSARQTGGAVVVAPMDAETLGLLRDWSFAAPANGIVIGPASALMVDKTAFLTELAARLAQEQADQEAEAGEQEQTDTGGAFGVLPTISQ